MWLHSQVNPFQVKLPDVLHPEGNPSEVKLPDVASSTSQQISVKQQHNDNMLPTGMCAICQLNDQNQYLIHYLHLFLNFLENTSYLHYES